MQEIYIYAEGNFGSEPPALKKLTQFQQNLNFTLQNKYIYTHFKKVKMRER